MDEPTRTRERQERHLKTDHPRTLEELASIANREHSLAELAAQTVLQHAIAAGEALIAAREIVPPGEWSRWLDQNFQATQSVAYGYIRVATHKENIPEGTTGVKPALAVLSGYPQARGPFMVEREQPEKRAEAIRMHNESDLSSQEIARRLNERPGTVWRWLNPAAAARKQRASETKRRKAAKALREQEREREIKRAVRKAGAALAEAYSMAERMGAVLDQAVNEAADEEAHEALTEAIRYRNKMRDQIVRALGVS